MSEQANLIEALQKENAYLRQLLLEEWEGNHAERCTNVEHQPGVECRYPKPKILESVTYWPVNVTSSGN